MATVERAPLEQFNSSQQTILDCVRQWPSQFGRSSLAKLLAGSHSSRAADLADHPAYGRLADRGRKAITFEIDILLQQGYLAQDRNGYLVPTPDLPHPAAPAASRNNPE